MFTIYIFHCFASFIDTNNIIQPCCIFSQMKCLARDKNVEKKVYFLCRCHLQTAYGVHLLNMLIAITVNNCCWHNYIRKYPTKYIPGLWETCVTIDYYYFPYNCWNCLKTALHINIPQTFSFTIFLKLFIFNQL